MELKVERKVKTEISTIGRLSVDGVTQCYTLEDVDRGLKQAQPLSEITEHKVFGKTAIPTGRYEVILNYSDRFKKAMPLLLNVPGYAGVRIHAGNKSEDTEGCILLGSSQGADWISESRAAVDAFMQKMTAVHESEKIFITIN